ncbi:MAG TPA: type II toxin-antitoxin system PemK/MazF family toxin [Vicinamibacteria bacterium]|nr:type II toxin-antitoxin system PemK/MazF family toxin [Vicinamibacteria bacterium]
MQRGEVWWAGLPKPVGSGPGYTRPVLVVQSNSFNASRIRTVIVAALTKNTALSEAPGNVLVGRRESGLRTESVVNVSAILSVDRSLFKERAGRLSSRAMARVDEGLRIALGL